MVEVKPVIYCCYEVCNVASCEMRCYFVNYVGFNARKYSKNWTTSTLDSNCCNLSADLKLVPVVKRGVKRALWQMFDVPNIGILTIFFPKDAVDTESDSSLEAVDLLKVCKTGPHPFLSPPHPTLPTLQIHPILLHLFVVFVTLLIRA